MFIFCSWQELGFVFTTLRKLEIENIGMGGKETAWKGRGAAMHLKPSPAVSHASLAIYYAP